VVDRPLLRLAQLLVERVAPAMPTPLALTVDRSGALSITDERTDHVVTVAFSSLAGWDADAVLVRLTDALNDIATEVGEATTERYEQDIDLDGGEIRLWFGPVPGGSKDGAWREVLAELAPIPVDAITPD
jgi:hypothetical protein